MSQETMPHEADAAMAPRAWMSVIGGLAGLAAWLLVDVLPDTLNNQRLLLWIASATGGFFTVLLALLGPLKFRPAFGVSAVLALSAAALLFWHNDRFVEFDDQFEHGFAPATWVALLIIGTPFGAALIERRVRDYAYLFDTAWNIVVRYAAAWVFVGLFWGALFLSDALLSMVGITLIEDVIDEEPVPFLLTGLTLGLALSVAQELRAYVSPYLLLRLLRLLLPMVLIVVVVFILALPLRGLSQLFGDFSAAAILMGVAIAGITLITSALDRDDIDAIASGWMRRIAQAMALILPVLAALACWAIALRVADYGLTPARIAAAIAAGLVMGYALLYAIAVLRGPHWAAHIRQANILMSLVTMAVSALWMSPLINAEKIASQTQLARYQSGKITAKDVPVWELQNAWGKPGQAAAAEILSWTEPEHAELQASLEQAKAQSRWQFNNARNEKTTASLSEELVPLIRVWPEKRALQSDAFAKVYQQQVKEWRRLCAEEQNPGCTLVFGPFGDAGQERGILVVPGESSYSGAFLLTEDDEIFEYARQLSVRQATSRLTADQLSKIAAGGFRIGPSKQQSLWIGDLELSPKN